MVKRKSASAWLCFTVDLQFGVLSQRSIMIRAPWLEIIRLCTWGHRLYCGCIPIRIYIYVYIYIYTHVYYYVCVSMCCMQFCFPPQPSFFPFCVNRPSRASIQRWLPAAVRCPSRCCTGPHLWRRAPRGAHKKCPGRKSRHQPAPWQRNFVRKWSPKKR